MDKKVVVVSWAGMVNKGIYKKYQMALLVSSYTVWMMAVAGVLIYSIPKWNETKAFRVMKLFQH